MFKHLFNTAGRFRISGIDIDKAFIVVIRGPGVPAKTFSAVFTALQWIASQGITDTAQTHWQ